MATAIGSSTEVNVVSFTQLQQEDTGQVSRTSDKNNYDKTTDGKTKQTKDSPGSEQDTDIIIRQQDAEAGLYKLAREMEAQKQQGSGGGNPYGGFQAEAAADSDSTSNTTGIFDKKDANQDGVVTFQEELVYAMNHTLE